MAQNLFKIGEFAKLCGTTKDTLFHYDAMGLLRPMKLAANGYRYYSLNQVYMFDLIVTLKEVGLTLKEVKEYMQKRDTENFVTMLRSKDKQIKREIDILVHRRKLLHNTLKITETSFRVEENIIKFLEKDEEYFIISDKPKQNTEKAAFDVLGRHLEYCNKHNYYDNFSTGEIIAQENIANGSFFTSYFSSRIDKVVKSKYLHVKPAGLYAVKYVRTSYNLLQEEYKIFFRDLNEMGAEICGNIYQNDITNYLSESDEYDYLMEIEVMVK